jgi:hypothetical protein
MSFSISSFNSASRCNNCSTNVPHTQEELDEYPEYVSNTVPHSTITCPILQTAINQLSLKSVLSGPNQLNLTAFGPKLTLKLWGKRVLESAHVRFGVMWDHH